MPKARAGPSQKSDLVEAAKAIKHVSKALKREFRLRRFPSESASYGAVESELAAASACLREGLTYLRSTVEEGAPDAEARIALQTAIQELIRMAKLLGEVV